MNRFLRVLGAILTTALLLATPKASALEHGDVVVQVSPAAQEIKLELGEYYYGTIKVQNTGRRDFTFRPLALPYQVKGENYDPDFTTENSYTKLHNWIKFREEPYELAAGEETELRFLIDVPEDIPGGGQYAAIVVETRDSIDENDTFQPISRVASILYAHVSGESRSSGNLLSHSVSSILLGQPISGDFLIQNDGNIDFRVTHTLSVRNFFTGQELFGASGDTNSSDSSESSESDSASGVSNSIILPDTTRYSNITWDNSPRFGIYKVKQTISFLGHDETFEQVVLACPLWLAILLIFAVVLVIVLVVLRIVLSKKEKHPEVL